MPKSTFNSASGRARRSRILAAVLAAPLLAGAVTAADAAFVLRAASGLNSPAAAPVAPVPAPQAVLVLSSANVDFGSVAVTDSVTATVALSNTGLAAGAVVVTDPGAPFSVAHDCPAELAPAASCTLAFTFSPTTTGNAAGSATVAGQAVVLGGFGDMLLVSQVVGGANHTVVLKIDGTLWAAGLNANGQLGLGDTVDRTAFTQVTSAGTDVASIVAGEFHTLIRKTDGTLWATGDNTSGQLGLGDLTNRTSLTQVVSAGTDVASIVAGTYQTLVLKTGGALWATGSNGNGQLGFGDTANRTAFTQIVSAGTDVASVVAGGSHTLVRKTGGALWATGYNGFGQLGLGDKAQRTLFTQVGSAGTGVASIAAGIRHTLALKTDGTLWATGQNSNGQLGLGDTNYRTAFTRVTLAGTGVASIAAGGSHTLAQKTDGTLWATGYNINGQLGLGDTTNRTSFTLVESAGANVGRIAAGGNHTLVLKTDGALWATGHNYFGQLGLGDTSNRTSFELVP